VTAPPATTGLRYALLPMHKLDRYILGEVLGPLLFGIGAFVIILVSVDILREAFKLIFRQGIPALIVAQAFIYQLPQTIALTLPMGTLFGVLMAMSRLSSEGEVVAIQAGGVSFPRIALPMVVVGIVVSLATFALNETISPPANKAARRLLAEAGGSDLAVRHHYTFQIPPEGEPDKYMHAAVFDTRNLTLQKVLIIEWRAGEPWKWFIADSAQWEGEEIVLHDLTYVSHNGRTTTHLDQLTYHIGMAPEQVARYERKPDDMSMAELGQELRLRSQVDPGDRSLYELRQHYHSHTAIPWCALGFALLAAPLALRPQRTSAGVGLGISLGIILFYYVAFYLLSVVGEQGAIPPVVAAWLPNVALFLVGIGLIIDRSR